MNLIRQIQLPNGRTTTNLGLGRAQLQTDQVDMFSLHAPRRNDTIADDLATKLHKKKIAGKIGAFGISGRRAELDYFPKARPEVCGDVIQSHFSVLHRGAESEPLRYIFSGILGVLDGLQTVRRLSENSFSGETLREFRREVTEGVHAN